MARRKGQEAEPGEELEQEDELELEPALSIPARVVSQKLGQHMAEILARRKAVVNAARIDITSSGIVHVWYDRTKLFSFAQPNGLSAEDMEPVCRQIMLQRFEEYLKPENFAIVSQRQTSEGLNVVTKDGYKYTL